MKLFVPALVATAEYLQPSYQDFLGLVKLRNDGGWGHPTDKIAALFSLCPALETPTNGEHVCDQATCAIKCTDGYIPTGKRRTKCRWNKTKGFFWKKALGACETCDTDLVAPAGITSTCGIKNGKKICTQTCSTVGNVFSLGERQPQVFRMRCKCPRDPVTKVRTCAWFTRKLSGLVTQAEFDSLACVDPAITTTTFAPTTVAPTTAAQTNAVPTTAPPTTAALTSAAPTTAAPTTAAPTTAAQTTAAPTTAAPTTAASTTAVPTTAAPTTAAPTTAVPTTAAPTTAAQTTAAPTTAAPTTAAPTTAAPIEETCIEQVLNEDTARDGDYFSSLFVDGVFEYYTSNDKLIQKNTDDGIEIVLGAFASMESDVLNYAGGDMCNGVAREAVVTVQCSAENSLVSVTEEETCVYLFSATITCDECAKCHDGFHLSTSDDDICLLTVNEQKTWESARQDCESKNGNLVTIGNDAMQTEIHSLVTESIWIGFSLDSGAFFWESGATVGYINWNENEPNNDNGSEECTELLFQAGWNDKNCEEQRSFVCENTALSVLCIVNNLDRDSASNGNYFNTPSLIEGFEYFTSSNQLIQKEVATGEEFLLGNFDSMQTDVFIYTNGDVCPNGENRIARITVQCGTETSITSTSEDSLCVYHLKATIPCTC